MITSVFSNVHFGASNTRVRARPHPLGEVYVLSVRGERDIKTGQPPLSVNTLLTKLGPVLNPAKTDSQESLMLATGILGHLRVRCNQKEFHKIYRTSDGRSQNKSTNRTITILEENKPILEALQSILGLESLSKTAFLLIDHIIRKQLKEDK